MASSNKIVVHLWTGRNPKTEEPPHVALANMRASLEATTAVTKRWGPPAVRPGINGDELDEAKTLWARGRLVRAWRGDADLEDGSRLLSSISATLQVTGERIEVKPDQLWQTAFLLFMRDRAQGKTAVCENPECPAPYFIRKRRTQKFCEAGPCVEYGARLRANKWWKAHGNDWRTKQSKKSGKGHSQK